MRAQVTLFIILGMAILIFGSIVFIYKDAIFKRTPELDRDSRNLVTGYVGGCLGQATERSLSEFGFSGGQQTDWTEQISGYPVSYGERYAFNLIPDPQQAAVYISGEIRENLMKCINLSALEGMDITQTGKEHIKVTLTDEGMAVELDYPLAVSKEGMSSRLRSFRHDDDTRLKRILQSAKDFVDRSRLDQGPLDPEGLDYSCGKLMVCHHDGIVSVYSYRTIFEPPDYRFRFATDSQILNGCTKMRSEGCI